MVRGLAAEFGDEAIVPPTGASDQSKPEFTLSTSGIEIDIEAKGLLDSVKIRTLNRAAIESGQYCWVTGGDLGRDMNRLRRALVRKMKQGRPGVAKIVVLTQYTPWPTIPEAVDLVRRLALQPGQFSLPDEQHPLAIAYVFQFFAQGVWCNQQVAERHSVFGDLVERLRTAIRESFYPRNHGIFLSERNDGEASKGRP